MARDKEWWRGAVTYQICPRSFQNSDGDAVGDLPGITRRLDHVASLGVDAIGVSPFFTSPMKDMGYDVSDYCGSDPLFETMADFDRLLARAHHLRLKIIIDQVLSHASDQHTLFRESRRSRDNDKAEWFLRAGSARLRVTITRAHLEPVAGDTFNRNAAARPLKPSSIYR